MSPKVDKYILLLFLLRNWSPALGNRKGWKGKILEDSCLWLLFVGKPGRDLARREARCGWRLARPGRSWESDLSSFLQNHNFRPKNLKVRTFVKKSCLTTKLYVEFYSVCKPIFRVLIANFYAWLIFLYNQQLWGLWRIWGTLRILNQGGIQYFILKHILIS